jgi:hypothetical protein
MHRQALTVSSYHVGSIQPYSAEIMAESKEKLGELARLDKERMMLEEVRNNFESSIYLIRNKLADDDGSIEAVTSQEQRDALKKSAEDAEEWMYDDGYDASYETYKAKYEELTKPADKVFLRVKEVPARAEAVAELKKKLDKVTGLMTKWETTMPQITEEERKDVLEKVAEVRKWLDEKEAAQAAADPSEDPVFTSAEVPLQTKEIQTTISKLSRRPKPKPKKEEKKNETDTEGKNETETEEKKNETEAEETTETTDEKPADSEEGDAPADEKPADSEAEDAPIEDEL